MNGTVAFDAKKKQWVIDAAPHVAIRLKRVFGKIARGRQGTVRLSDTEETARDLEWFLARYPMDVVSGGEHLVSRSASHKERASLVASLLARKLDPPAFDLAIPPRDYQRTAAALALATGGLLLADDLGVGKTVSAICMLADARTRPALVVTLTHLPKQWEREIHRFAPNLRTHILKSGKPYDMTARKERGAQLSLPHALPDVIITSYSKLAGWGETLAALGIGAVIFDEVQELRNMGGGGRPTPQKYSAAAHIAERAAFRLGLSATPIYNYGAEFYSVLNIIRPGALGTKTEFYAEWTSGEKIAQPAAFGAYTRECGLMLRRTRKDVGRELPSLTKVVHEIEADTAALDAVSSACAELARAILADGESERGAKLRASEELSSRLRQATGIGKAPFAAEFVRMLAEGGEKVLVLAWHREVYTILSDRLKDLAPVMYTGTESPAQKDASRRKFVDGDARVMLMSLRSGAGLDGLQAACRTVVFAELDWSPGVHEQATGRVHRDGQEEPVVAYYLVADSGSDPIVVDVLGLKREQIEGVRDPASETVERLEVDGDRIKRLAAQYLAQRGLPAPTTSEAAQ